MKLLCALKNHSQNTMNIKLMIASLLLLTECNELIDANENKLIKKLFQ